MSRKCGTCNACCVWPAVLEINKPAHTKCKFLHQKGFTCTIYKDRPKPCSDYMCSWLQGIGSSSLDQPLVSGVLMDVRATQFGMVLVAKATSAGTLNTDKARDTLKRAAESEGSVLVVADYDRRLIIDAL